MKRSKKLFSEVQAHWYQKLKDSGFKDIENTKDNARPLLEWHSFKFIADNVQVRKAKRESYQIQIDLFANHQSLDEIARLLAKHGNCLFDAEGIKEIWDLHRHGMTERWIAGEMKCSQSGIHFLLRRMREWMRLL
jgi:hypothetical protein